MTKMPYPLIFRTRTDNYYGCDHERRQRGAGGGSCPAPHNITVQIEVGIDFKHEYIVSLLLSVENVSLESVFDILPTNYFWNIT